MNDIYFSFVLPFLGPAEFDNLLFPTQPSFLSHSPIKSPSSPDLINNPILPSISLSLLFNIFSFSTCDHFQFHFFLFLSLPFQIFYLRHTKIRNAFILFLIKHFDRKNSLFRFNAMIIGRQIFIRKQ